jgi:putative ABC transport system permease protein
MSVESRPPALSRRLLEWAAQRLSTPELAEDALELFAEREVRDGPRSARRWYRSQARAAIARLMLPGLKPGSASGSPAPRSSLWTAGISLDAKLGIRMLVKHPALSLVSALGIAVAVAIGASVFGSIRTMTASDLPLHEGDRVVTIQNTAYGGFEQLRSTHLHDLTAWREQVDELVDLGAYRIATRNVATTDGQVTPARTIEMTASGFRLARVPPMLGRYLIDEDEQRGAPDVAVIGHSVWRDRFGGRPDVVGQTLMVGATKHTIVGVMPEGFVFPINNRIWTPLRLDPLDFERGAAPEIDVFARLAPGATLSEAQAKLTVVGQRLAATVPTRWDDVANREPSERLQPRIFPYTQELFWGPLRWLLYLGQLLVSMLLMVIAINVAALMYARTATRSSEIIVRTALGASRGRVVTQLFAESLVLSSAAAALGLVAARWVLGQVETMLSISGGEQMPFWWDFELTASMVLYTFGSAVVAAVIIGVLPALGVTGPRLRAGLQSAGSGGAAVRLGRKWTFLIVAQVAGAVAILPVALNVTMGQFFFAGSRGPDFETRDVLWAALELDRETIPGTGATEDPEARYARLQAEVLVRLEDDPQLSHVVPMRPAPWQDPDLRIEIEGVAKVEREPGEFQLPTGNLAGWSGMGTSFTEAFGIPVLEGRSFDRGDVGANVVIVSQTFVDQFLGGGNAVGRLIRPEVQEPVILDNGLIVDSGENGWGLGAGGGWFTIVGVVPAFPKHEGPLRPEPKIYQPVPEGAVDQMSFAVRIRGGDPASFSGRLREIVASVDPMLRLSDVATLDQMMSRGKDQLALIGAAIAAVAISVVLLSIAGLYALMSFTILGRRREIGIRAALGAHPRRVLARVLKRAMVQIALGIIVGAALTGVFDKLTGNQLLSGRGPVLLPVVAVMMAIVGLLAAWGPTREGLRIQPTEALRSE